MRPITDDHVHSGKLLAILIVATFFLSHSVRADVKWPLNPKIYSSPSGEYKLMVDPSSMEGAGPGTYQMIRNAQTIWAGDHPFTMCEAVVTDDGRVAGYAYQDGCHIGGHHGSSYRGLVICLLDSEGNVVLRDPGSTHDAGKVPRDFSFSDSPAVLGIFHDAARNRAVVRVPSNKKDEETVWWTYDLERMTRDPEIVPEPPATSKHGWASDLFVEPIPGTPLILIHWFINEFGEPEQRNARLSIVDGDGRQIWKLDLRGEYEGLEAPDGSEWHWYWDMVAPGISQTDVERRAFSFRSYREKAKLFFDVLEDAENGRSDWVIREVKREPDQLPVGRGESEGSAELKAVQLKFLGEIELNAPEESKSVVREVIDFAIDADGRIGFVQRVPDASSEFLLLSAEGELIARHSLELGEVEGGMIPIAIPMSNRQWIILRERYADDGSFVDAWRLDVATGALEAIDGFEAPGIEAAARHPEGGFVLLSRRSIPHSLQDELRRFDRNGKEIDLHVEAGYGRGLMLEDIACRPDGSIVGVSTVPDTFEYFDANLEHTLTKEVSDVIGKTPNYPSTVEVGSDGTMIFGDFGGDPPIYRIDPEGQVVGQFTPRYENGRDVSIRSGPVLAADGTLWMSDGFAILRLDDEGVVDRIFGRQPDDAGLGSIEAMTLDRNGRIYAADERSGAIHVFTPEGEWLYRCVPDPDDLETGRDIRHLTVDRVGNVYMQVDALMSGFGSGERYAVFDTTGNKIAMKECDIDSITETWYCHPTGPNRWVLGYEALHLVDEAGQVTSTISRRPSRKWIGNLQDAAVGPDGSIAIIASPPMASRSLTTEICVYESDGTPSSQHSIRSHSLFARIAMNDRFIVTAEDDTLILHDLESGQVCRFDIRSAIEGEAESGDPYWFVFMPSDSDEIWLADYENRLIRRFQLPTTP